MPNNGAALRHTAGLILGFTLAACTWFANGKPESEAKAPLEIINGGLLVSDSGQAELGLMLVNTTDRTLWASVHFKTPRNREDCLLVKELEPRAKHMFLCPQSTLRTDTDYPVHITAYADLKQSEILTSLDTSFRFDQGDIRTIQQAPKP